jgi:RNA polymerase sigma factor (sigma-70 family)
MRSNHWRRSTTVPISNDADPGTVDALALRYQRGEVAALHELYELLTPLLRRHLYQALRGELPAALQAADLQQESWLILATVTRRWQPRPGIPFVAYVNRLFPWAVARWLRAQSPARRSRACRVYDWPHERLLVAAEARSWTDGREWDDRLYCTELLRQLEPRARAALWLHAVEQRTFTEIARALGVPRATAFDLYRRAVAGARRAA